ncbi:Hypothetical predicted protein [Marmota monax]|uniref:Uncharacterized protein n=1 Tax=Marmota monax TaxID=9995 RepID=A0A5E4CF23_MARMO|nr:Hypothetical predicted protein [Marmota monax]
MALLGFHILSAADKREIPGNTENRGPRSWKTPDAEQWRRSGGPCLPALCAFSLMTYCGPHMCKTKSLATWANTLELLLPPALHPWSPWNGAAQTRDSCELRAYNRLDFKDTVEQEHESSHSACSGCN